MALELKAYQQEALEKLEEYLRQALAQDAKPAFVIQTDRPYREAPRLPDIPYVCLRIPTGGGKTLMACHALGIATRAYRQSDHTICLWLVPSDAIREQTLKALRDRQHPYRQALDVRFAGNVRVMNLTEALYVQRNSLEGETVIVVSTLQALRVEDTQGRKVYESDGALQHHFTGLSAKEEAALERRQDDGTLPYSLCNVLRLWSPIVIMDEAHNARTPLSFETLARFGPLCIIEFTATPETRHNPDRGWYASNVLCHVSAAQLKAEEMVKLPIKLHTRGEWKEVMGAAVEMQRKLEAIAREEERETGEYLRPIVLLQAQARSQERQTLTVEVVKETLLRDFRVPEEQIAIATGETREIDGVDVLDRACELRFIITMQALREGWDCPFAYVLCSVADIRSARSVEQILGRTLRLPGARWKRRPELNVAYAFAASPDFLVAARSLQDALVENGFQRLEARDLVTPQEQALSLFEAGTLFGGISEAVTEAPDLSGLPESLRGRVRFDETSQRVTIMGTVSDTDLLVLRECFNNPEDGVRIETIARVTQGRGRRPWVTPRPSDVIQVPLLAIRVDGELEAVEESHFLEAEWNLSQCDATLTEADFPSQMVAGSAGEVDVDKAGVIRTRFIEQVQQRLSALVGETGWTIASLANWLDRRIPHPDIVQEQSSLFIYKGLHKLMEQRGVTLEQLARRKFPLCNAIAANIDEHRKAQRKRAFTRLLFGEEARAIEVSAEVCLTYEEDRYGANWYYEGGYEFRKHRFSRVGELKSEGEEFDCAVKIDSLPAVKTWVRNLSRKEWSFSLPTSTDRFYPDFVALLEDGRILVVEYKGGFIATADDAKEKLAVGQLWADRSQRRCVFAMPAARDWNAITAVTEGERQAAG